MKRKVAQKDLILNAMRDGTPMDQVTALRQFGVKALSTVIGQLRKEGYYFDRSYHPYGDRRILTHWHLRLDG